MSEATKRAIVRALFFLLKRACTNKMGHMPSCYCAACVNGRQLSHETGVTPYHE